MMKLIRRLVATLLMLAVVFISTPTPIFANSDLLLENKTNKLTIGATIEDSMKNIEGSSAAGKSQTYKISIPKGTFYIQLFDYTNFKIEIHNSKKKLVKRINAVETFGEEGAHIARGGVALSKGIYTIKISPVKKDSALNLNGTVAMIKNDRSKTVNIDEYYHTAVTEGKTYKITFKTNKESLYICTNAIFSYDPNDFMPYIQTVTLTNSAGKTIEILDEYNQEKLLGLKKGTYTMTFKASKTGYLYTLVEQGD